MSRKILSEALGVVASRKLPRPSKLDMSGLAALPWVTMRSPNAMRRVIDITFMREGLTPNVVAEADSLEVVLSLVSDGVGVTLLPIGAAPAKSDIVVDRFFRISRSLFLVRHASLPSESEFVFDKLGDLAGKAA
jgi:DNA-binding transcriptional LysR family regulator